MFKNNDNIIIIEQKQRGKNVLRKKMVDDLLQSISKLSEDVSELQSNSRHLYDLFTNTEMNMERVNFRLLRLRQDVFMVDQKFVRVVKLWEMKENNIIAG